MICHEFGHMLGLPDLYARPENPGSTGLGNWCVMSNQQPRDKKWEREQSSYTFRAEFTPTGLYTPGFGGTSGNCPERGRRYGECERVDE